MKDASVLITGATGFIAPYILNLLLTRTTVDEVKHIYLMKRPRTPVEGRIPESALANSRVKVLDGDITDLSSVRDLIRYARPDYVFHLAAQSYPSLSWKLPRLTMDTNVIGTMNLLETMADAHSDGGYRNLVQPSILIPGSAAQYGDVRALAAPPVLITEDTPFNPGSPYAVSKCAQELLSRQFSNTYPELRIVQTRSFIHTGPGQADRCVLQAFCKQVAEIENQFQLLAAPHLTPLKSLAVGNLEAVRDFMHVEDAAEAFMRLMFSEDIPEYSVTNICTGQPTSIADLLGKVLDRATRKIETRVDVSLLRPVDERYLVGDPSRLKATGWTQRYSIDRIVDSVLLWWRRYYEDQES